MTHMPALLVASVSRQTIKQPKVITLMRMRSISVTWMSKQLARAPKAVAGCPVGRCIPWKCTPPRQPGGPDKAQGANCGPAKGAL